MKRLRLTSPAQRDYIQTLVWLDGRQPGLAREFDEELEAIQIRRDPARFAKVTNTVYKTRLPRFKHGIFFTVDRDEIGIVAIYHPSRDPDALKRRLR